MEESFRNQGLRHSFLRREEGNRIVYQRLSAVLVVGPGAVLPTILYGYSGLSVRVTGGIDDEIENVNGAWVVPDTAGGGRARGRLCGKGV